VLQWVQHSLLPGVVQCVLQDVLQWVCYRVLLFFCC